MIYCIFYFDTNQNFKAFIIQGHSPLTSNQKLNTLCIGISILSQSIILGFSNVLKVKVKIKKKSGILKCNLLENNTKIKEVNLFISLFIESINNLKIQFPSDLEIVISS